MLVQHDRHSWNVRALLETTATPFTTADYAPRAAIFLRGTGAFLGEEALAGCGERRQSATAMTATQVLVVPKPHMIRLLRTQPGFVEQFLAHVLGRNIRLEANLTEQLLYSSLYRRIVGEFGRAQVRGEALACEGMMKRVLGIVSPCSWPSVPAGHGSEGSACWQTAIK